MSKSIVNGVFPTSWIRAIWTGNYRKVLPISIQEFSLGAVLPAVFYMFRFGRRRGAGRFADTFSPSSGPGTRGKRTVTIGQVAARLARSEDFAGFDDNVGRAILGDLLLCFCLENMRREPGRTKQIQRVAPAHYMASWIDLPDTVAHLRFVPEMIVSTLAAQDGQVIALDAPSNPSFPVGQGDEENVLLSAFRQGIEHQGILGNLAGDKFIENNEDVGIDQLLIVRIAQELGEAPGPIPSPGKEIINQRPVARRAAEEFAEDIQGFVRSYADPIPRLAFLEMLEACMALGLATILTSTVEILAEWERTGAIPRQCKQRPIGLFVDCSNGIDRRLRTCAEQSMDSAMRSLEFLPILLMILRLLDLAARMDRELKKSQFKTEPYATKWIDLLGGLYTSSSDQPRARQIHERIYEWAFELSESGSLREEYPEVARVLKGGGNESNSIRDMAEALIVLMGKTITQGHLSKLLDSALLADRPNGLAKKRTSSRKEAGTAATRQRVVRSAVFTDPALDYLVHIRVLKSGTRRHATPLSLRQFLRDICERYGLYVDAAPPGTDISHDLLRANRTILERRLRDLGLLTGVNDAEEMKRLRPRFKPKGSE